MDNQMYGETTNTSQTQRGAEIARDKYCWECDTNRTEYHCWIWRIRYNCSKCFRSFHGACLEDDEKVCQAEWRCPICIELESSKNDFVGKQSALELLKYTVADILQNAKFQELQQKLENFVNNSADVINPVDLIKMKKKVDDHLYDSLEAFAVDAECILHNIGIRRWLPSSSSLRETVNNLVKFCEAQIENIKGCAECYENKHKYPSTWSIMACKKLHICLWTKHFSSRKYLPVKLISIVNDEQIKVVRFDGESSDFINISSKNCYLYSNEAPAYLTMKSELKEVMLYITNAEKQFGTFRLAAKGARLKVKQLATHVKEIYPDYNGIFPYDLKPRNNEDGRQRVTTNDYNESPRKNSGYFSSFSDISSDFSIGIDHTNENGSNTTVPIRKRRLSSKNIGTHADIESNTALKDSNRDDIDNSDSDLNIGTEIPKKRLRILSESDVEIADAVEIIDHDNQCEQTNDSGLAESIPPPGSSVVTAVQEWAHSIIDNVPQIVQTGTINFGKTENDLKNCQEKIAEYEKTIKYLNEKIQVITSERDISLNRIKNIANETVQQTMTNTKNIYANEIEKIKQALTATESKLSYCKSTFDVQTNETHALKRKYENMEQSNETQQTKINDLLAQIQVITSENVDLKNAMAVMRENHKKSAEQMRKNLEIGHQKIMNEFERKLKVNYDSEVASLNESHGKVLNDHQMKIAELLAHTQVLNSQNLNAKQALAKANNGMAELRESHIKSMEIMRASLETDHRKAIDELEREHDGKFAKFCEEMKQSMEMEKDRAIQQSIDTIESRFQDFIELTHDKYCWACDKGRTSSNCRKCFRSFHKDCANDEKLRIGQASYWECPICIELESSKNDFVEKHSVLDLLKYTMVNILQNAKFQKLQQKLEKPGFNCAKIVNPIDLKQMKKKADERLYDSLEAFVVDADCILHNISLLCQIGSDLYESAKSLGIFCNEQIENIEGCAECYENKHKYPEEWRFMACSKPNIVLWTKHFSSRKYLPVRLISIVNDEQIKVVRFGGHSSDFVNILANNCFLYSDDSPAYGKHNLERELKEVKSYITNAEKKFGTFHLASIGTRFLRNQLDTHVKAMYPDYNGPCPYGLDPNNEKRGNGDDSDDITDSIEDDSDDTEYSEENSERSSEESTDDSENEDESDSSTTIPSRKRFVSSEDIDVQINTMPDNNSQDIIEHADTDMDTGIPTKKQRIFSENEIVHGALETVQHDHQYDTSVADDSCFNNSSLTSSSFVESSPDQSKAHTAQGIDSQIDETNCETTSTLNFEAVQKGLNFAKKKITEYEKMNKSLTENDTLEVIIQDSHQYDMSIANDSGFADSTSPPSFNSAATVQDLVQSISQIVQTKIINFDKTNQVKLEALQNELKVSKEKNAEYERMTTELSDRLQIVTSERDRNEVEALQAKQALANLKLRFHIEHQKAKDESAKSQKELSTRIQTITNEIKTLNQKHQQEVTANQTKIDGLVAQIEIMTSEKEKALAKANEEMGILKENYRKSAEQQRQILQIGHQKAMEAFEIKLQKEHANDQKKSEEEIYELKKKNEDLMERLAQFSTDIETITSERTLQAKQMADLKEKHTKAIEELHKNLEADHQKAIEDLKKVHDGKLANILSFIGTQSSNQ
ncbi:uncharacterized protein LOC116350308 [Contarinia nasturtii]|uniref:uncharacterized protein LOC116350308 n=1 Tax=Contarinia nasturtii TaxID=265458 RepID=UPI0012D48CF8|nr:uncharacterized protein LOC116350308 [Contarinia nasturtii]